MKVIPVTDELCARIEAVRQAACRWDADYLSLVIEQCALADAVLEAVDDQDQRSQRVARLPQRAGVVRVVNFSAGEKRRRDKVAG